MSIQPRRRWSWILALTLLAEVLPMASPKPVAAADPPMPAAASTHYQALAVSAGDYHTCAIATDGTLACWGDNEDGEATPPAGTFTAVSAGGYYTCAIATDGTLACWKSNWAGQATPPAGTFTAVSAGDYHTCAIATDGTLACWGNNGHGQATPPTGTYTAVSAGLWHTCAIATDGTLACWGNDDYGQATPPSGTFMAVSAGDAHTCAIATDGTLACWGNDDSGQATPPSGTFMAVSAGGYHTCAIATDGTLACWGSDRYGRATPPSGTFMAVSAGGYHTCAIATDGTLACWGDNYDGQATPRPGVSIMGLPRWLARTTVPLAWRGWSLAQVTSYDVRFRRARWDRRADTFEPWVSWRTAMATSAGFKASPGYTYCFSVRAHDAAGKVSRWAHPACTAIPLDDRSLTRSAGWTALAGPGFYRSTALRSSSRGAKLTRTGPATTGIALLATTCPTCGTVKVYWNARLLRTVSLSSATRIDRKLIPVVSWWVMHTGTLTIKVVSSGKKVIIDGLAIRHLYY